jgi:GNAT superfamily N-acetyltransferase
VIAPPEPATVVFAREPISQEFLDSLVPLLIKNFNETAYFKDLKLMPDLGIYHTLEKAGILRIYTARSDGKLAGYSIFSVCGHSHYMTSIVAKEEVLFIDPAYRRGMLGDRMIKFCDDQLTAEGVHVIYHTVTVLRDWSPLLLRNGYELCDKTYAKKVA